MSNKKTHRNLDELNKAEIEAIAKGLKISLLDHKESTLKELIRAKWRKLKIEELPFSALATTPKKKPTRKENYQFNRKFTAEELKSKSMMLSQSCIDRNSIEDEKKMVMSEFKAKLDAETSKINMLAGQLQSGSENVLKTCEVIYDYDKAIKKFYYEGVEVGEERMVAKDFQLQAELEEA